jgi:hypothetical protein
MLVDVGPTLRAAMPELHSALRDEYDRVARGRAEVGPVMAMMVWSRFADDLRCVLKKARTGRLNEAVCGSLVRAGRRYAKEGL